MATGYVQTVDQCVSDAYLLATGKAGGLTFGTTKYIKLLQLANQFSQEYANMDDWKSLRNTFTVASVVTATNTFALPSTIHHISQQEGDYVRINHTDGINESDYDIVPIERLYNDGPIRQNVGGKICAIAGSSLVFPTTFAATDPQFGGSILVPGYSIPATLLNASDPIIVDDPTWLSARMAAEFVRNDITRVQNYPSLIDIANERMANMKANNQSQVETVYTGGFRPMGITWS